MSDDDLDLTTAETAPFTATDGHQDLHGLAGSWDGVSRTWIDPERVPDESRSTARIAAILGGRFIRIEYRGTVMGKDHAGEMLIGYEPGEDRFTAAWVDSFHMATGIMMSAGERASGDAVSLLGSYDGGGQSWGWRTVLRRIDDDHISIESFNISPEGREDRAIETRLTRRS